MDGSLISYGSINPGGDRLNSSNLSRSGSMLLSISPDLKAIKAGSCSSRKRRSNLPLRQTKYFTIELGVASPSSPASYEIKT